MSTLYLREFCAQGKSRIQVNLDTLDSILKNQVELTSKLATDDELYKKWVGDTVDAIRNCFKKLVSEVGDLEAELVKKVEATRPDLNREGLKKLLTTLTDSNRPKINRVQMEREEELERKLDAVTRNNEWKPKRLEERRVEKTIDPPKENWRSVAGKNSEPEKIVAKIAETGKIQEKNGQNGETAKISGKNGETVKIPAKNGETGKIPAKIVETAKIPAKIVEKIKPEKLVETLKITEPDLPPLFPNPDYPSPTTPTDYLQYKKLSNDQKRALLQDPIERQRVLQLLQKKEEQREAWILVEEKKEKDFVKFMEKSEERRVLRGNVFY